MLGLSPAMEPETMHAYSRRKLEPPSTGSATPVMKLASSEARNSAALATSQGVPMRLRSGT